MKDTPPPPVDEAGNRGIKKIAAMVGESDQLGECNEELEDLLKKEMDVS